MNLLISLEDILDKYCKKHPAFACCYKKIIKNQIILISERFRKMVLLKSKFFEQKDCLH